MSKDFIDGLFVKSPRENAPDFVKGSLSILVDKFIPYLKSKANAKGYVNINLLISQDGNLYAKLNEWKPQAKEGENTHLAFNDPPADFETEAAYLIVDLDNDCRKQQLGEGWFKTLEEVPGKAISMSVKQILKSKIIICSVPDVRKAAAIKKTIESNITPDVPASILKQHNATWLYLDEDSASLLSI